MSFILLFLLFGSTTLIFAEIPSEIDRVIERLQNSAEEFSITELSELPKAASYINSELIKDVPHQLDLSKDLTKFIPEWTADVLAFDPTCPYYFSKFNNISSPKDDLNLLSYLQAIGTNKTFAYPFINILPQSYRLALPLLSIFQCEEYISSFFYNIELMIGPGKTELPLQQQQSNQLYCSLYGTPKFVLVNQTKDTYNTQDNLSDTNFLIISLSAGTCIFVPSNWVIGGQLNNSISLVFTLKPNNDKPIACTKTSDELTLETVPFTLNDTFNTTRISLIIYFYEYLNPPLFDKEYTRELFFEKFQDDKEITQLIMKWTPELINLIKIELFDQLDINHDELFNIIDYFDIKQSNVNELEISMINILEGIRETVFVQYNELSEIIKKLTHPNGMNQLSEDDIENLEIMLGNLPDTIKKKFKQNNLNIQELLNKIKNIKSKTKQKISSDL